MQQTTIFLLLLATAGVLRLPAQAAADADSEVRAIGQRPGAGRIPVHVADHGIWAAGAGYKVGFRGDMTFIPYLGPDYPRNQPWSWRTAAARIGTADLLAPGTEPRRRYSDFRYEYDHAGLTEVYDVLEEGLEQSFVVPKRPPAIGDLVIIGRVTSDLRAAPFQNLQKGIDFADAEGRVLLRYGAGVVFDATGRRGEVLTSHEGGTIRLTVSGAWLAEAVFPVTIDPLLTPINLHAGIGAPRMSVVDVARDDLHDEYMAVYTQAASSTDHDVIARMFSNTLGNGTTVFTDLDPNADSPIARVACAGQAQNYCVAFERRTSSTYRIRYHVHTGGNRAFNASTTELSASATAGEHHWRPDVGGTTQGLGGFAIVFQRERAGPFATFSNTNDSSIGVELVTDTGVSQHRRILAPHVSGTDREWPTVNQTAKEGSIGAPAHWFVMWQEHSGSPSDAWYLAGRLIDSTNSVSGSSWSHGEPLTNQRMGPQLAGRDGRYLVAYSRSPTTLLPGKPSFFQGHGVAAKRIDWVWGQSPSEQPERVALAGTTRQWFVGGCGHDHDTRSHWAATVSSDSRGPFAGTGNVLAMRFGYDGGLLESLDQYVSNLPGADYGLAGGVTFDDDANRFANTHIAIDAPTLSGGAVARFYTYPAVNPQALEGTSCSAANIVWVGRQWIGSEFSSVRIDNAPTNQLAFLLVGVGTANQDLGFLGMSGCRLLVPSSGSGHIGTVTAFIGPTGSTFVRIPLPSFLTSGTVFFQYFHVAPGANTLGMESTQRLRVPLVK